MKQLLILMINSILFLNSSSQSLEGEWKGTYTAYFPSTTTVNKYYDNDIKIDIILNEDSTYTVYSYAGKPYARGHYADYKCEITCAILGDDNIMFVETKVVQPENGEACLKTMNLKIVKRKKSISLEGIWQANSSGCDNRGEINISKKL
ncbi:MAG: hypothetical protein V4685_03130 [Bacteroidota bacterium]